MGDNHSGTCWDMLDQVQCRRRYCRPGWTCSCHQRTHLCRMILRGAHMPLNPREKARISSCRTRTIYAADAPVLKLGSVTISISARGSRADACNEVALFHNGNLIANFPKEPSLVETQPASVLRRRQYYDKLELRPDDVVAFRFHAASYYCFLHHVSFVVNGKTITSDNPKISMFYARRASRGWFLKDYNMNGKMAVSESDPDLTKWLRPRAKMLTSGLTITPKVDYWDAPDQSNPDRRISNYYWRIRLPNDM